MWPANKGRGLSRSIRNGQLRRRPGAQIAMKNPTSPAPATSVNGPAAGSAAAVAPPVAPGPAPMARRRWGRRLALALAGLVLALLAANGVVVALASPHCRAGAEANAVRAEAIVVPGARIHADGRPYNMLVDRLATARELWRAGVAPRIVLSGRGGGGLAVDEVASMRRWLEQQGVPPAALLDDGDGLRTIATMQRCRDAFGLRSVVVVTNGFHLARSVFLARHCGLEAIGVAAPAGFDYSFGTIVRNQGREVLARAFACGEVCFGGR
jgi:vancomycin permeability regulator SanA